MTSSAGRTKPNSWKTAAKPEKRWGPSNGSTSVRKKKMDTVTTVQVQHLLESYVTSPRTSIWLSFFVFFSQPCLPRSANNVALYPSYGRWLQNLHHWDNTELESTSVLFIPRHPRQNQREKALCDIYSHVCAGNCEYDAGQDRSCFSLRPAASVSAPRHSCRPA